MPASCARSRRSGGKKSCTISPNPASFSTSIPSRPAAAIAAAFPQDRSVISRHLASLHAAGVLRREKVGRRVVFEVDGAAVIERLEEMLARFRDVIRVCCPPPAR